LFPSRVDKPALRTGRRFVRENVALDATVLEGGKIITRCPEARRELLAEQIILCREAFETNLAVAIIFKPQDVEIVLAARNRKIRAPPVFHALELDEMSDLEAADLVGAIAKRNVEGRFVEGFLRVVGTRKDRQPGNKQRHVTSAVFRKARDDG